MKLRNSARTDVGRTRDHNEDNYGVAENARLDELGHLFVVCDGMGGHAAGEVASQLGVEMILNAYYETAGENRADVLDQAFERANLLIHTEGRGSMGTTGVAALIANDVLHIANVGDSRAYLIRNGAIHQISRDHSLVGDQLAAGLITAEQARSIHYRNVITRALGYQPEVTVDLFRWPLEKQDLIVLTSDGLHGLVTDDEIRETLTQQPLDQAVDQLVDLANERGGTDNITMIAIAVDELDWQGDDDDAITGELRAHDPAAITQPVPVLPQQAITVEMEPLPEAKEFAEEHAEDAPPEAAATLSTGIPAAAPTAPPSNQPRERRLTVIGGLLAALLLVILIGVILVVQAQPPAVTPITPVATTTNGAQTAAPTTAATTAPTTAAATPAATAAATAAPTPAATAAATAAPTSAPAP
jgi:serine/threonine protein phosphatase PrpC